MGNRMRIGLLVTLLVSLLAVAPVQAQEPLETVLARAAATGFLTSLTRPELAGLQEFYLLDSLQQAELLNELGQVSGYEISDSDWVSEVSYQVKAVLQPEAREIAVYTGRYDGRWRVEGIDLPTGPVTSTEAEAVTSPAPAGSVAGNGSGQLVFQTESGGQIYLIKADGTGLRQISQGMDPQLSPDGSQIAFSRWAPRYELFTINTDGTGEQAWSHGWRQLKSPTWTADGSRLIFSWQDGGRLEAEKRRINLADAAREGDRVRIPSEAIGIEVENGILSYTIPADALWLLKQVELASGQLRDLPTEQHSYGPSAHPQQSGLLIYRGDQGLALHNLEAGFDQVLTRDGRDHSPVISPDGSQIVVSYWQEDHWEVHRLNIDGTGRQRLTRTPLTVLAEGRQLTKELVAGKERVVASENPAWNNAAPVWSPDGSQLAFVTDRTGQWEIWIMNADGTNQRPMFPNGVLDGLTLTYHGVDERMLSWR